MCPFSGLWHDLLEVILMTLENAGRIFRRGGAPGRTEAGQLQGQVRPERKARAARENGRSGGRPCQELREIPCVCWGGAGIEWTSRG
jgi:hypothetical protein